MPGAAQKAFQLATDPNAEARDFIEVIESDEALSARVIKIANSVYFDRGNKSATIEASVTVIGIKRKGSIIISPGPYALFEENDIFIMVGREGSEASVRSYLYDTNI